ncbi:MAG: hypothetical protein ABIR78_10670 [Ferruginibacter sp.]
MKNIIIILCFFGFSFFSSKAAGDPPAGKIYFSDKPFTTGNAGNKTSFKSSEFIYGRLELNNQTLKDAFKLPEDGKSTMKNKNDSYLRYTITITKDGYQWGYDLNYIYVLGKDKNSTSFNFDVLPNPAQVTSLMSMVEEFDVGFIPSPLYREIDPRIFNDNGNYTVKITLSSESHDGWGKAEPMEKWPVAEGEFDFAFDANDIATLKKNSKEVGDAVQNGVNRVTRLPDYFANSTKLSDPMLSNANINAILKRDLPGRHMTLLKFAVGSYTGPLWKIEKNDLGLILRRYVTPDINVVFKFENTCYIGYVRLWQEYQGGGKYGPLIAGGGSCNTCGDKIDCSLVK